MLLLSEQEMKGSIDTEETYIVLSNRLKPMASIKSTVSFFLLGILLLRYGGGLDFPVVMDANSLCRRTRNISF